MLSAILGPVSAQSFSPVSRSFLSAAIRSQSLVRDAVKARLLLQETAQPPWTLQMGVGYDDSSGPRVVSTGVGLEYDFDPANSVLVTCDIYDRVSDDGTTATGHGDPSFNGWHVFALGSGSNPDTLTLVGTVNVPTGSSVGASAASQVGTAIYAHPLTDGHTELWAAVKHDNADFPSGESSVSWIGQFWYYRNVPQTDADVFGVITREYRQGGGGVTTLGLGTDFTIYGSAVGPFTKIAGTLTGTCGVSSGTHCGAISLTVKLPFGK
jgi:hypothetical protein